MKENSFQDKLQDESINLREQIDSYFKYWPWFLFSVIITYKLSYPTLLFKNNWYTIGLFY